MAAAAAGMLRLGPLLLTPDVRSAYLSYHGAGSLDLLDNHANVAVATLPFSMFMDGYSPDPAVIEVIAAARSAILKNGSAIFTVKWDTALRMGVHPEEYVAAVAKHFPKLHVTFLLVPSDDSSSVVTTDLFILATPLSFDLAMEVEHGLASPRLPRAKRTVLADEGFDTLDPQEIFSNLGFPEDFLSSAVIVGDIHEHLRESVAIPHATIIMRSLAARIRVQD